MTYQPDNHFYALQLSTAPAAQVERNGKKLFRKELIYVGDFIKKQRGTKNEIKFSVRELDLHHWKRTHADMLAEGIVIPVPTEHTEDVEKRRGTCEELEVATNSKGLPALFGYFSFRDDEAAKLAKTADVSIYVPPEYTSGKGTRYVRPITHVALTDYPVIPGLGKFEALAASQEVISMSLASLAEKIKLPVADKEDAEIEAAIATRFNELVTEVENLQKQLKEKSKKPEEELEEVEASFVSPTMRKMAKENRQNKLDTLVSQGKITKAVSDKLAAKYCTDDALTLALSSKQENFDDGFDSTIEALKDNAPSIEFRERTKGQTIALGNANIGKSDENPLLKNAQARAEAARR